MADSLLPHYYLGLENLSMPARCCSFAVFCTACLLFLHCMPQFLHCMPFTTYLYTTTVVPSFLCILHLSDLYLCSFLSFFLRFGLNLAIHACYFPPPCPYYCLCLPPSTTTCLPACNTPVPFAFLEAVGYYTTTLPFFTHTPAFFLPTFLFAFGTFSARRCRALPRDARRCK